MSRYIDADALIKHIKAMPWKDTAAAEISKSIFLSTVEEAPTAYVVEVRHGEWIEQYEGCSLVKCSVCDYEYCDRIECGNYCSNCGAKMDGQRRSDDEG